MTKELKILQNTDLATVFDSSLQPLLNEIEKEVSGIVPDISTKKGRDEVKSLAFKVVRSKTAIDAQGKKLVDHINLEMKNFTDKKALINASRKESNAFLKDLSEKIRLPLTEYEEQEAEDLKQQVMQQHWEDALAENEIFDRQKEVAAKEIELEIQKAEQEAERQRIVRDQEIREQEKANTELARRAAIDSENRAIQAEKDKAKAIKQAKIAADKIAEQGKIDQIAHENQLRFEAKNAEVARQLAVKNEAARLEGERQRRDEKAKADLNNVKRVNNDILNCFILSGFTPTQAKKIVVMIAKGQVQHVRIDYCNRNNT